MITHFPAAQAVAANIPMCQTSPHRLKLREATSGKPGIFAAGRDLLTFWSVMKVIITAGPSSEPIDQVRLITNRSTGELGVILAEAFWSRGHHVNLFLGRLSQFPHPQAAYFDRNEDLQRMLRGINEGESVNLVLHAAALADFEVTAVRAGDQDIGQQKIGSHHQMLSLQLTPKPKVITGLRDYFPKALIVGWKLELEGSRDDLIREAIQQLKKNLTDACVINGPAFGDGFGFCTGEGLQASFLSKLELASFLVEWGERNVRSEK
jgi:phosphopantothenoylcysteine synthetase/decarboxylase